MQKCSKKSYSSRKEARKALRDNGHTINIKFRYDIYYCQLCGEWHIGHRKSKKNRMRTEPKTWGTGFFYAEREDK